MKYLVFDTETTGLSNKANVLTAYFMVLSMDIKREDSLYLKIKHETYHIEPKAMEINGIDLEIHETQATTLEESRNILDTFLAKNEGPYIPFGQNIYFDLRALKWNGLLDPVPELVLDPVLDTMFIGRHLKDLGLHDQYKSLSLTKIAKALGLRVSKRKAHTADYDVKLTIKVFKKYKELLGTFNLNNNVLNK